VTSSELSTAVIAAQIPVLPGARAGRDPARVIKRGPSRLPPGVVAATQRDRLYDGLAQTVAERGYAAARVSDICQAAGVTRPVFYTLFDGKEDAFLATYRHGVRVLLRVMDAAYQEAGNWRAGIRGALRTLLGTLASVPAFATMAVVEIDAAGPAARRERDHMLRGYGQYFASAPPQPGLPDHSELVACVVGGIYWAIHGHVSSGRAAELPGLLPSLTYFTLAPFLGPAAAAREAEVAAQSGESPSAPCVPAPGHRTG
jgi:AcrR family transcriptional regulator